LADDPKVERAKIRKFKSQLDGAQELFATPPGITMAAKEARFPRLELSREDGLGSGPDRVCGLHSILTLTVELLSHLTCFI
jgi:hypothetical protein